MPEASFRIPGRFHPPSSLLGRILLRRLRDPLRAEAWYLLGAGAIAVALILGYFLGGAIAGRAPSGGDPTLRWTLALGAAAVLLLTAGYGRQDPIVVRVEPAAVTVEQSGEATRVPIDAIRRAERVSARTYHRHHRKYARVRRFVNRPPETVLLLHADRGPVALGLTPEDQRALCRLLDRISSIEPAGEQPG